MGLEYFSGVEVASLCVKGLALWGKNYRHPDGCRGVGIGRTLFRYRVFDIVQPFLVN